MVLRIMWSVVNNLCVTRFAKRGLILTVSRHTFHRHLLATSMHQQDMCLLLLKVEQSAFTEAFFSSLSGIHKCSGSLKMVPSSFGKHTAGCESPHDCLMSLAMDLAALWHVEVKMAPLVVISLFLVNTYFVATHPPPTFPPCRSATAIGYASKKLSKMAANPASYPVYSRYNELLWIAIDLWRNTCR